MRWYTYLKSADNKQGKALFDYETIDDGNLIVCQNLEFLTFGRFINYLDFGKYMIKSTSPENRCFYETIFGTNSQKPYFDIEFYVVPKDTGFYLPESEADESVRFLVDSIYKEINEILNISNCLQFNKSHILVFTSHSEEKRSYHVVVEGFTVGDCKQNREFHNRIIKRMPDKWRAIVDHSMYKSLQQFRIVCNTKWKSNRYKTLNESLTLNYLLKNSWIPKTYPDSIEHKFIILLEASLITQTGGCTMLPNLVDEDETKKTYSVSEGSGESIFNPLTPDDIKEALSLCYKYANLEFGDPKFPYSYLRTVERGEYSALILLKRHRASNCAICKRVHEHENPYLIIAGENRDVYLDCRRNDDNKKLHVGSLGLVINPMTSPTPANSPIKENPVVSAPKPKSFNIKDFINGSKNINPIVTKKEDTYKEKKLLHFTF